MSWPKVKLKDVCSFMTGGTPSTKDGTNYLNGDIPWIVSGDIHLGEIFDASKRITQKGMSESPAKFLPENSVLIALNGQGKTRATVALLRISGATCNQSIIAIIPTSCDTLDYHYLFVTLRSMYQQLRDLTGHEKRAGLNMGLIGKVLIPLPPLAEQKRIAGILDAADALRARRRESLAQLDTLLQSTYLDMFGDPVTNPMGWNKQSLRVLATTKPNNGVFRKNPEYSENGEGLPVVWVEELFRGNEIDTSKSRRLDATQNEIEKYGLRYGDLLFCRSSLKLDGIAYNNVFLGKTNEALFECHLIRVSPDVEITNPMFLSLQLRSVPMRAVLKLKSKTATMTTIDQKALSSVEVVTPPIDLQCRFAAIVESVEQQKARQHVHLAEVDTLFSSLQKRAFSGELF